MSNSKSNSNCLSPELVARCSYHLGDSESKIIRPVSAGCLSLDSVHVVGLTKHCKSPSSTNDLIDCYQGGGRRSCFMIDFDDHVTVVAANRNNPDVLANVARGTLL